MNNWKWIVVVVALGLFSEGRGESMYTVDLVCPIGGQKFTHLTSGTSQVWGQRPDGKTYSDWPDPMPLPVCPNNGLVVFAEFSKDDIKKLKPLIASREYQSMRKIDTEYYLVYWLKGHLGVPVKDRLWTLMQASWQADGKPEVKRRYQSEFVEAVSQIEKPPELQGQIAWVNLQARRVNGLRELSRFEEASSVLNAILIDTLQHFPEPPQDGNLQPVVDGKTKEEIEKIGASVVRASVTSYLEQSRIVIARRDPSAEPFDMLPIRVAASRCIDERHDNDDLFNAVCKSDRVVQRIERMRRLNLPTYRP